MKTALRILTITFILNLSRSTLGHAQSASTLFLYVGFVTKFRCQGRLLISSIGNEALVKRSVLPDQVGCGILLSPQAPSGKTNLILETSTGTLQRLIEIREKPPAAGLMDLDVSSLGSGP